MSTDNSVQTDADSTGLEFDAVEGIPFGNPDEKIDAMFDHLFPEAAAKIAPEEAEETVEDSDNEYDEVSGEIDRDTPDDDTPNVDETDEADDVEVEETSTPDEVVSFEEMRNHSFEIDGKVYSANDIKAAFGRQSKQEQDRNEVEQQRLENEAIRERLDHSEYALQYRQAFEVGEQRKAQVDENLTKLREQLNDAIKNGDDKGVTILNGRITQLNGMKETIDSDLQKFGKQMVDAERNAGAAAVQELHKFGLGELATDVQRQGAFKDYALEKIPHNLMSVVNTSPELLAMVEQSRLWEKAQSGGSKGKLKTSQRSLKGGAAKSVSRKKPVSSDPVQAKIDQMFSNS